MTTAYCCHGRYHQTNSIDFDKSTVSDVEECDSEGAGTARQVDFKELAMFLVSKLMYINKECPLCKNSTGFFKRPNPEFWIKVGYRKTSPRPA